MTSLSQSPTLAQFYTAINEWIELGCPYENKYNFVSNVGLCGNLTHFCLANSEDIQPKNKLHSELYNQFIEANLPPLYPFYSNDSLADMDQYEIEKQAETVYSNPLRLKWIKDHISEI